LRAGGRSFCGSRPVQQPCHGPIRELVPAQQPGDTLAECGGEPIDAQHLGIAPTPVGEQDLVHQRKLENRLLIPQRRSHRGRLTLSEGEFPADNVPAACRASL
jgi:hypothetical protein